MFHVKFPLCMSRDSYTKPLTKKSTDQWMGFWQEVPVRLPLVFVDFKSRWSPNKIMVGWKFPKIHLYTLCLARNESLCPHYCRVMKLIEITTLFCDELRFDPLAWQTCNLARLRVNPRCVDIEWHAKKHFLKQGRIQWLCQWTCLYLCIYIYVLWRYIRTWFTYADILKVVWMSTYIGVTHVEVP